MRLEVAVVSVCILYVFLACSQRREKVELATLANIGFQECVQETVAPHDGVRVNETIINDC